MPATRPASPAVGGARVLDLDTAATYGDEDRGEAGGGAEPPQPAAAGVGGDGGLLGREAGGAALFAQFALGHVVLRS